MYRLGSLMTPSGWLLEAVFEDNMTLEGFGGISNILRGTILVSVWNHPCECVSEQEKQH